MADPERHPYTSPKWSADPDIHPNVIIVVIDFIVHVLVHHVHHEVMPEKYRSGKEKQSVEKTKVRWGSGVVVRLLKAVRE